MAMRAVNDIRVGGEARADMAKDVAVFFGSGIADRVRKIDDRCSSLGCCFDDVTEIIDIAAACVLSGELDFLSMLRAKANHLAYLIEGFVAFDSQLVL